MSTKPKKKWWDYNTGNPTVLQSDVVLPVEVLLLKIEDLRKRYLLLPDTITYSPTLGRDKEYLVRRCAEISKLLQEVYILLDHERDFALNIPLSPVIRTIERVLTARMGTYYEEQLDVFIGLDYDLSNVAIRVLLSTLKQYKANNKSESRD